MGNKKGQAHEKIRFIGYRLEFFNCMPYKYKGLLRMMQHIFSNQVNDLGKIFDENIELVSVDRPRSGELESLADKLFLKRTVLELDWQQETRRRSPASEETEPLKQEEFTPLASEITHVTELLLQLFNWKQSGCVSQRLADLCVQSSIQTTSLAECLLQ